MLHNPFLSIKNLRRAKLEDDSPVFLYIYIPAQIHQTLEKSDEKPKYMLMSTH